ncbi:hypothetical protein ACLB2K_057411 [Fragaria x ananassa]
MKPQDDATWLKPSYLLEEGKNEATGINYSSVIPKNMATSGGHAFNAPPTVTHKPQVKHPSRISVTGKKHTTTASRNCKSQISVTGRKHTTTASANLTSPTNHHQVDKATALRSNFEANLISSTATEMSECVTRIVNKLSYRNLQRGLHPLSIVLVSFLVTTGTGN